MAITVETRTDIIELIVGMVGAAPGAAILSELADIVDAGLSLNDLAIALANNPAFKVLYPSFLTSEEFATNYLTALMGAEVDATTLSSSIDAMVADLNSGTHRGAAMYTAITTLSATAETDANFGAAAAALNNKTEVAVYYSVTTQQSAETLDELVAVVSTVTSDDATVTSQKAVVDGTSNIGTTFTLKSTQDDVVGAGGNDTILGLIGTGATLSLGDVIDGGAGIDTLSITTDNAAPSLAVASISNVEKVTINSSATAAGAQTFNLNNGAYTNATISGVAGTDGGATALTVNNVLETTALKFMSLLDTSIVINYSTISASATDVATVEIAGSTDFVGTDTDNNVTIAGIDTLTLNLTTGANDIDALTATDAETVTINVSGGNAAIEGATDIDNAKTVAINAEKNLTNSGGVIALADSSVVTVSGAGNVSLGTLDDNGALKGVTLNGSTMTGKLTAIGGAHTVSITGGAGADNLTSASTATTIVAGAGDDRVSIAALDYGTGTGTVTGGDGTDTLNITDPTVMDAATLAKVTGFETLSIAGGSGAYGLSGLGFTSAVVDADLGGAASVTGITTETLSITATTTAALTAALKSAVGASDALTVTISGGASLTGVNDLTVFETITTGIETITIDSSTAATNVKAVTNTLTTLSTDATKLVVSGNNRLTIANLETELSAAGNTSIKIIDASASDGLTMTAATGIATAANVSILGSEMTDTLIVGTAGSTINAGGGGDVITSAAGALDTLILNAGDSVIGYIDVNKDVAFTTAADIELYDIVTGFVTTQDTLDLGSYGFTGTKASAVAGPALTEANAVKLVSGTTTSIASFFIDTGVTRGVAVVSGDFSDLGGTGTDTLVFVDTNGDGNLTAADDMLVLAGTAGVALGDFGF